MFSIRNAVRFAGVIGVAIAAGCQSKPPAVANTMSSSPIVIDGAMQARDWDKSYVMYQNGTVKSPADRFLYQGTASAEENTRGLVETPLFLANIAVLPFTFFSRPPGNLVDQSTDSTPESFSAMPSVEAAAAPAEAGRASNSQGVPSHSSGSGQSIGGVSGAAPAGH